MSKTEQKEYVEVNFSKLMIPVAIILAGGLIALAIFLGGNGEAEKKDEEKNGDTVTFSDPDVVPANLKLEVEEGAYIGNLDKAKFAIVEFSDYQCPYCQRHYTGTFPSIKDKYLGDDDFVYLFREVAFYPPKSMTLSALGQCVFEEQGVEEYLTYHGKAFEVEFETDAELLDAMNITDSKVKECFEDEKYTDRIDNNSAMTQTAGMQGVPGFIVGTLSEDGEIEGYLIPGAYPISMFEEVLDHLTQ
jgi:protein-disulfide isomerase